MTRPATRADLCVIACADVFGAAAPTDGSEMVLSPMAPIPRIAAQLAALANPRLIFADPIAPDRDAPIPYRHIFDVVWAGKRHVMMGASQIDRFGAQNISCLGPYDAPKVMLLGVRGAPGNTINHPTSYWIARHSSRVFVPRVDMVSGIGTDAAAKLGKSGRFAALQAVITGLGVFDFATVDGTMRVRSLHPGVTLSDAQTQTGFPLAAADDVPESRAPTAAELVLIAALDTDEARFTEIPKEL